MSPKQKSPRDRQATSTLAEALSLAIYCLATGEALDTLLDLKRGLLAVKICESSTILDRASDSLDNAYLYMTTMPRLRSKAYLTCFYCGRKTSTRNDGSVRRFECPSCEATNYLDEVGFLVDLSPYASV